MNRYQTYLGLCLLQGNIAISKQAASLEEGELLVTHVSKGAILNRVITF